MAQDDYGFFGPSYSFADAIPLPGDIGVRSEPSFAAIIDSVAGVNFYVDTIAFGGRTFFDQQNPQPMGIRYYMNTGMRCANGATMSEYFDGVTRGDLLGDRVAAGLASAGLPGLRGLAPGMLENARDALDPRPILAAVTATGYPVCQQVTCPVGDVNGAMSDPATPGAAPFILGDVEWRDGRPHQRRWVQAYDATGAAIQMTKDEFGATPKCYNADGTYMARPPAGCPTVEPAAAAAGTAAAGDRYKLCGLVQAATVPASVGGGGGTTTTATTESFQNLGGGDRIAVAAAAAVLGGLALWAMSRK